MPFFGRELELEKLDRIRRKATASIVVVKGRRRIGKSSLVERFGETFERFYEFQGLAPRPDISNTNQLANFSQQMKQQFDIPALPLPDWTDAFAHLASHTTMGQTLILLDEISWMAGRDSDFAGKLKIAWDTRFKKNPNLVLVLCGSASSWIERNILREADFVGRISLAIDLEELPLPDCNMFWGKKGNISPMEKLKVLAVTGGVPKYLEEIDICASAEENIKRICFDKSGLLFSEFDKIFGDIFDKRTLLYKRIVGTLAYGNLSALEICRQLDRAQSGAITEYLSDLETSGFISKDCLWRFDGKKSRLRHYRLKDNYLRFYLRYIEPRLEQIEKGLYEFRSLENLNYWSTIVGYQFENLILNNLNFVFKRLNIDPNSVVSASPYFQGKTKKNKGACQIDLLINSKFNTLYLCEIKFKKRIGNEIIKEIQDKIRLLKRPKYLSIRPVLIYEGDITDSVRHSDYFDTIISFGEFLTGLT